MRRDVIHMRERTTASATEAVERNQGKSHANGASSPLFSLFFFFFF